MSLSLAITLASSLSWFSVDPNPSIREAVGLLEVFPFKDDKESLRCTAFHIGEGYVVSAAHCFLGAQACNRARVWFGLNGNFKTVTPSYCQFVSHVALTDQSSKKTSSQPQADFIIFKVDNVPAVTLKIEENFSFQKNSLKSYSYTHEFKLKDTACTPQREIQDAFGRKRHSRQQFGVQCHVGLYAHGSPLLNSEGKVIALHQASLFSPQLTNDIPSAPRSLAITLPFTEKNFLELSPKRYFSIGGFEPESFSYGLPDKLNLHVISLPATQYPTTFLKIKNSSTSAFVIIDANKKRFVIRGLGDESSLKAISIRTPAEVYLQTPKNVFAINDSVEIIP